MSATTESARRILRGVGYGAAIVAPLLLLLDLSANLPLDGPNHVWMVSYYGEYFRQHGELPTFFNIAPAVGMSFPVFYAWLLYPALGVLSAGVGPALALRLAVFGLVAIQFCVLLTAGRKIFGAPGLAGTMAGSVIWATFSLTNLYNRGALAEYFATGFLVAAIGFGGLAALAASAPARWFHGWLAGFFLILIVGTHPPTAVLAAAFLALLGAGLALSWWRGRLTLPPGTGWQLAAIAGVGAVIIAPWLYASLRFGHQLAVTLAYQDLIFRPDHCDTFWGRFAPFPYDAASTESGILSLGAPYLEAPINMVLLGLLGWNLELCRRAGGRPVRAASAPKIFPPREILAASTGWFLFLAVLSLSPWLAGYVGFLAPYVQYVYRLVSHINAALLVAVLASGVLVARSGGYRRHRHQTSLVMAVCLTVAILGLWIKLQHAALVVTTSARPVYSSAGERVEIARSYAVTGPVRRLDATEEASASRLTFRPGQAGVQFGEMSPARVKMEKAGWVLTNAVVFPWMKFERAGRELRGEEVARIGQFQAIHLPAGEQEIRPVWRPDPVWSTLHRLSQFTFLVVLVLTVAWAAFRLGFSRGAAVAPASNPARP